MRDIAYLSPTSLHKAETDLHEFYKEYLADNRPPRLKQTEAMSVGSAFDAYVKNALVKDLFGQASGKFDFETLFTSQVEAHNRDFARTAGLHCFTSYKVSGAYAMLLRVLQVSPVAPRFEFTARSSSDAGVAGAVAYGDGSSAVPILGKPDCAFEDIARNHVILDWKVNGYMSKMSPAKGYERCYDGWSTDRAKRSRSHGKAHKEWFPAASPGGRSAAGGIQVNALLTLDQVNAKWALQQATYGWLAGFEIGSDFKVAIDQLACGPAAADPAGRPLVRVALHRALISSEFQKQVAGRYAWLWDLIQSGWIFRDMSEDESIALQEGYDRGDAAFGSARSDWFEDLLRSERSW